jgi:peptidoglycan/LPS O-acetylase OafA/YrhL
VTQQCERGSRLRHVPGLDGLRGLAVIVVLFYHQGFRWARGGYLGVSTFFTLSGFLIASLLLADIAGQGRLQLPRFWERRARRLLPAAFATIVGIVLLQLTEHIWTGGWLRGDILSALGYSANWRFAVVDRSYGALFGQQSPVLHFWSLAIEEQFYLLFPLLFAFLFAWCRRRWPRVGLVLAALACTSFGVAAVTAAGAGNGGFAYYGTHCRAGELLVGTALAVAVLTPRVRSWVGARSGRLAVQVLGVAGLGVLGVLWATLSLSSRRVFSGGVELNALATAAVIMACRAAGPVAGVLSLRPLRYIGRISYGLYLYHWPLYQWLTVERLHLSGWPLFGVRGVASLAVAALSFRFLETPIRYGQGLPRPKLALSMASVWVVVAVLVVSIPQRLGHGVDLTQRSVTVSVTAPAPHATSLLLAGDSMALTMVQGFKDWNRAHPGEAFAFTSHLEMGCPVSGKAIVELGGKVSHTFPECNTFVADTAAQAAREHPQAMFVIIGLADLGDHRFESGPLADGRWHHLGEPAFDRWELDQLRHAATAFASTGVPVVWATFPDVQVHPLPDGDGTAPENDPARVQRFNELLGQAVAGLPNVHLVDFNAWMKRWPGGEFSSSARFDGVHLSQPVGSDAAVRFVAPYILRAAHEPGG